MYRAVLESGKADKTSSEESSVSGSTISAQEVLALDGINRLKAEPKKKVDN